MGKKKTTLKDVVIYTTVGTVATGAGYYAYTGKNPIKKVKSYFTSSDTTEEPQTTEEKAEQTYWDYFTSFFYF
jgi:hypothetical protein